MAEDNKANKRICISLIDYENCSNLKNICLDIYQNIVIFSGKNQNIISLPVSGLTEDVKITVRHTEGISKNNVDFHLVLELGQLVSRYGEEREYHIISVDKGYDGIIQTLQKRGVQCRRVTPVKTASVQSSSVYIDKITRWADKVQLSARNSRNMPVALKTFNNYLKSQMREEWNEKSGMKVRNELVQRGVMKIKGNRVVW